MKKRQKPGRPRAIAPGDQPPAREAILLAAAQLFARQGYSATSTREIADRVGIRQPSLFYHFPKKTDILIAIVEEAASNLLERLDSIETQSNSAAQKLFDIVKLDSEYLMTEPFGIGQLMMLPELRSGELQLMVSEKRDRILRAYKVAISNGIDEGVFNTSDSDVTAHLILGMVESLWRWYTPEKHTPPESIATKIAELALRGVLVDVEQLQTLQ